MFIILAESRLSEVGRLRPQNWLRLLAITVFDGHTLIAIVTLKFVLALVADCLLCRTLVNGCVWLYCISCKVNLPWVNQLLDPCGLILTSFGFPPLMLNPSTIAGFLSSLLAGLVAARAQLLSG